VFQNKDKAQFSLLSSTAIECSGIGAQQHSTTHASNPFVIRLNAPGRGVKGRTPRCGGLLYLVSPVRDKQNPTSPNQNRT
jgi:hypothetical protein